MALVKYNPLRELRTMQEQMNRLLNLSWNHDISGEDTREGIWQPAVDIYETEDSIVIKAEVPDVDQKDIDVRIEDNTLTLRGSANTRTRSRRKTITASSAISDHFSAASACRRPLTRKRS